MTSPDPDLPAVWTASQERTLALVGDLSPEDAERTVPATDAWTVRQLVSHMVGVGDDALKDAVAEDLSPAWTEHHVDDRKDRSLAEVAQEWRDLAPRVRELLATGPAEEVGSLAVDAYWHEQDLRTAFPSVSPVTEDPALQMGLEAFAAGFGDRVTEKGLPAVRLTAGSWTTVAGEGAPQVEVQADAFELGRALSGRRSAAQVRAFSWTGDPEPYLPVFSMFGDLRQTDLVEQG